MVTDGRDYGHFPFVQMVRINKVLLKLETLEGKRASRISFRKNGEEGGRIALMTGDAEVRSEMGGGGGGLNA